MLQTCKMNDVDLYTWAKLTLERIANRYANSDIEALMPWNFNPSPERPLLRADNSPPKLLA